MPDRTKAVFRVGITPDFYTDAQGFFEDVLETVFGGVPGIEYGSMPPQPDNTATPEALNQFDAVVALALRITADSLKGVDRLAMALTPEVLMNVFAQFNDLAQLASVNARFSWNYRPGSDIFLVYNQTWDGPGVSTLNRRDRQLMLKVTRLLQR